MSILLNLTAMRDSFNKYRHVNFLGSIKDVKVTEKEYIVTFVNTSYCPCCGNLIDTSSNTLTISKDKYEKLIKWIDELNK